MTPSADGGVGNGDGGGGDGGPGADGGDGGGMSGMCPDFSASKNVYWGDLHSHTIFSADAYAYATRNTPFDAYQFAMGQPKQIASGSATPGPTTQARALDWDAITDHSEWLAATDACGTWADGGVIDPDAGIFTTQACQTFRSSNTASEGLGNADPILVACGGEDQGTCASEALNAWQEEQAAVHAANQPCTFTTLAAYEWTHETATANNSAATLHHNVIFSTETVPTLPFDSRDFPTETQLWTSLDNWRASTPECQADASTCQVLTIPHNSNLSHGLAFELPTTDAGAIDPAAVAQMVRYQTLVEIHQAKGSSECYAGPDASDPTCDFEHLKYSGSTDTAGTVEDPKNFVRNALGVGLAYYQAGRDAGGAGVNPLQLGIIGATDNHNGTPGDVAEDAYAGHAGITDDTPALRLGARGDDESSYYNPGAITGVWAEQNTRDRVFAALARREAFATSGPRIAVRFYQVWSQQSFCGSSGGLSFPENVLAAGGLPMGSTMGPPGVDAGTAIPHFVINATKDQTDLAEVDIIKVAVVNGSPVETVQRMQLTGTQTAAPCVEWDDTSFVAGSSVVYYVRVLQAPTPRWSSYDCQAVPSTPNCQAGQRLTANIQERAWTSPIWWMP